MLCRLLAVLIACSPLQFAQAGMIGTEHVVSAAAQAERSAVLQFLGRTDVAGQLQSLGVDPAGVRERVAAMTDQEVRSLAGQIQGLPAGADSTGLLLLLIVAGVAVWYIYFRR
jgi:hypothetical protein